MTYQKPEVLLVGRAAAIVRTPVSSAPDASGEPIGNLDVDLAGVDE
jgi:hypothetical protein